MKPFAYARPKSLAEVHALLSPTARPRGGGMDLLDLAKNGVSSPATLVNLAGVVELAGFDIQAGVSVNIACGTTLAEMFVFIGFLAVGLLYAWKKGVLEWT